MDLQTLKQKMDQTGYIYDETLATVLMVALKLGRPLLIEGAAGVGKTEITKIIAKELTGVKPIILNMAEYHSPASINRIIGSPAGYVGSDSKSELPFDCLESNPYQIILLDEFEKCDLRKEK